MVLSMVIKKYHSIQLNSTKNPISSKYHSDIIQIPLAIIPPSTLQWYFCKGNRVAFIHWATGSSALDDNPVKWCWYLDGTGDFDWMNGFWMYTRTCRERRNTTLNTILSWILTCNSGLYSFTILMITLILSCLTYWTLRCVIFLCSMWA